jgi:hypothetical protein
MVTREHRELRERQAILLAFLDSLRSDGSWCGDAYLTCAVYLLQELLEVPLGYEYFVDMREVSSGGCLDDLGCMVTERFLSTEIREGHMSAGLTPGVQAHHLRRRWRAQMERFADEIQLLAPRIQAMKRGELATLTIALFISRRRCPPDASQEQRAQRITAIKPHLEYSEALEAVRTVDALAEECRRFRQKRAECPTPVA